MKFDPTDLRQEMDEMLSDYGHYVLLHRTGRSIRCRCWNEKYQEADSKCMLCGGTGWVSKIERHQVRHEAASQVVSGPSLNKQTELGKMWIDAQHFYMRYNVYPKVGDFIYEVGWNEHKPTHLMRAYQINDIEAHRGNGGRVEYWSVAARAQSLDMKFKNIFIRSIGPIKNYEIVK